MVDPIDRHDPAAGVLARNVDEGLPAVIVIADGVCPGPIVKPAERIKSNDGRHHRK